VHLLKCRSSLFPVRDTSVTQWELAYRCLFSSRTSGLRSFFFEFQPIRVVVPMWHYYFDFWGSFFRSCIRQVGVRLRQCSSIVRWLRKSAIHWSSVKQSIYQCHVARKKPVRGYTHPTQSCLRAGWLSVGCHNRCMLLRQSRLFRLCTRGASLR